MREGKKKTYHRPSQKKKNQTNLEQEHSKKEFITTQHTLHRPEITTVVKIPVRGTPLLCLAVIILTWGSCGTGKGAA